MNGTTVRTLLTLALAALAAGCTTSDWRYVRQRPNQAATTRVTVTSEPAGAEVLLNGDYMGTTPFVVPIKYSCEVRVYERRKLLPYLQVEAKELRTWVHNDFTFHFHRNGYRDEKRVLELEGQEEYALEVELTPK